MATRSTSVAARSCLSCHGRGALACSPDDAGAELIGHDDGACWERACDECSGTGRDRTPELADALIDAWSLDAALDRVLTDRAPLELSPPAADYERVHAAVLKWAVEQRLALEWSRGVTQVLRRGAVIVELRQPAFEEAA